MRLSSNPSVFAPRGLDRWTILRRLGPLNVLILLSTLVAAVLLIYLLSGQPIFLLGAVLLACAGAGGLLRTHPAEPSGDIRDTALYLFVPVLFTLGAGVFFRYTLDGAWQVLAAIAFGAVFGAIVNAEYHCIGASADQVLTQRLILNLAAYLAAFALYTALYNQRLPLLVAAFLVGAVSFLIGVDILRETEIKTRLLLIYGATLGFIMADARWALNFISLGGWLGGVFILVVFYVASQLMQSYLWGRLDRRVIVEFAIVAAAGTTLVVIGRALSHA